MNKKDTGELHEIVERAAEWPEQARDELEEAMLNVEARYYGVFITSKDDRAALKRSDQDVRANRFASESDIKRVFQHFNRA